MFQKSFNPAIYLLAFASHASADPVMFFQIPGERKIVGSWSLVLQQEAAVMVTTGESTSRKFPNTLELSAPGSSLLMTCNAGSIQFSATLPNAENLKAGSHEENFGTYVLWVDDALYGKNMVKVRDVQSDGDNLSVPIFSLQQWSDPIDDFLDATAITVRASAMNLDMVTATYHLSGTREAFSYLQTACGWSQP
jgi:hypothetical protein